MSNKAPTAAAQVQQSGHRDGSNLSQRTGRQEKLGKGALMPKRIAAASAFNLAPICGRAAERSNPLSCVIQGSLFYCPVSSGETSKLICKRVPTPTADHMFMSSEQRLMLLRPIPAPKPISRTWEVAVE